MASAGGTPWLSLLSSRKQEIHLSCERHPSCTWRWDILIARDWGIRQRRLYERTCLLWDFTTPSPNSGFFLNWAPQTSVSLPCELLINLLFPRLKSVKGSSLVAQWVEDPVLSLLWCGFDPWLRNFHMPWMQPKKNKKKNKNKKNKKKKKKKKKKEKKRKLRYLGVPWWLRALRTQCCHCCVSDYCCGTGLTPGPETSICHRSGQEKNYII